MRDKVIGVLGGMGPEATVELMRRIIAATPATDDADHIRMIVDNNPKVPSRIKALIEGDGDDPGPVLAAMARGLETAGAEILVIPCNTAHHYLPVVQAAVTVPVLDVVELTATRLVAHAPPLRRIGMLASPAVRLVGLFDRQFPAHDLTVIYPPEADQTVVLDLIRDVKAGRVSDARIAAYNAVAQRLVTAGADALLIACTELSTLAVPQTGVPIVDTLEVLVHAVVTAAKQTESA
ncbi:MAG: amino acid racemase [Gammaproteobacteria bacterium]